jgi:hypothetical protein
MQGANTVSMGSLQNSKITNDRHLRTLSEMNDFGMLPSPEYTGHHLNEDTTSEEILYQPSYTKTTEYTNP